MIFLIHYDRNQGRIISMESFGDSERAAAQEARLALELELNGANDEVVLLDAEAEEDLRKTHRRYFEALSELLNPPSSIQEPSVHAR